MEEMNRFKTWTFEELANTDSLFFTKPTKILIKGAPKILRERCYLIYSKSKYISLAFALSNIIPIVIGIALLSVEDHLGWVPFIFVPVILFIAHYHHSISDQYFDCIDKKFFQDG